MRHKPYPYVVRPAEWIIVPAESDTYGHVRLSRRPPYEIAVPVTDSHLAEISRAHELAHARFSAYTSRSYLKRYGIHPRIWSFAEDARIGVLAQRARVQVLPCTAGCEICDREYQAAVEHLAAVLEAERYRDAPIVARVLLAVACGRWGGLSEDVRVNVKDLIQDAARSKRPLRLARYLQSFLRQIPPEADEAASELAASDDKDTEDAHDIVAIGVAESARMTIATLPLRLRHRANGGRSWRPSESGVVLRYDDRYALDRHVFAEQRRQRGGAVLIDASGSMQLDGEDIARILDRLPQATIAAYCARSGTTREDSYGELAIIARNGRMASSDDIEAWRRRLGGANAVDVPALLWLARQRGIKLWISDGRVTDWRDSRSATIASACSEICRRARIRQIEPD